MYIVHTYVWVHEVWGRQSCQNHTSLGAEFWKSSTLIFQTPRSAQTPGRSVHKQPVSSCDHNKRNARHLAPFSQRPQSAEPIKQEENLSGIEALNCDVTLQSPGKKAEDLFSYTTITSNMLPSKFSGKENIVLEQCEISSIGSASYEEFTVSSVVRSCFTSTLVPRYNTGFGVRSQPC